MKKSKIIIMTIVTLVLINFGVISSLAQTNSKIPVTITSNFGNVTNFSVEKEKFMITANNTNFEYIVYGDNGQIEKVPLKRNHLDKLTLEFDPNYLFEASVRILFDDDAEVWSNIRDLTEIVIDLSNIEDNWLKLAYKNGEIIFDDEFPYHRFVLEFNLRKKSKIAMSGKDTIVNNIDKPYNLDQISRIAELKAYDSYEGDITDRIFIYKDNYSINQTTVGQYSIEYSVINKAGLQSFYELIIVNVDLSVPNIIGPKTKRISYQENFSLDDVLSLFTVEDNSFEEIILFIEETNFVENKVGTFNFLLSAIDSSKNKSSKTFTLEVYDDIKPVIVDESSGTIIINFKEDINDELLLQGLLAIDEVDGDITNKIKIIKNDLNGDLGTFKVIYEVSDMSGNKITHERLFEVVSTSYPTFWVSKNLLSIENVNKLNIDQLIELLASYENILVSSYEIINDEYSNNYDNVGIYNLKVKIIDINSNEHYLSRDIKVFSMTNEITKSNDNKFLLFMGILVTSSIVISVIRTKKNKITILIK